MTKKRQRFFYLLCALGSAVYYAFYYNNFGWQISKAATLVYWALVFASWKIFSRRQIYKIDGRRTKK